MRNSRRLMEIRRRQVATNCNTTIQFNSEDSKPHFFKIIVSPLTQNFKLRIPVDFVKNYGRHLSDYIYLSVPNSEQSWKVQLAKAGNSDMFLEKGWQVFMEFYNINFGHLLVFRFDGGSPSQFHVLIFDKSATEIDYPIRTSCAMNRKSVSGLPKKVVVDDETEEDDDVSVEILDELSPKLKRIKSVVDRDSSDSDVVECSSYGGKGKGNVVISVDLRKKLMRKLDSFGFSYPHFKSIMYASHVCYKYSLNVPFEHASIHFPRKSKEIILRGANGKSYNVRFYVGKRTAGLLAGWKIFVLDNKLEVGDACVFELTNSRSNSYKVSIFRKLAC